MSPIFIIFLFQTKHRLVGNTHTFVSNKHLFSLFCRRRRLFDVDREKTKDDDDDRMKGKGANSFITRINNLTLLTYHFRERQRVRSLPCWYQCWLIERIEEKNNVRLFVFTRYEIKERQWSSLFMLTFTLARLSINGVNVLISVLLHFVFSSFVFERISK